MRKTYTVGSSISTLQVLESVGEMACQGLKQAITEILFVPIFLYLTDLSVSMTSLPLIPFTYRISDWRVAYQVWRYASTIIYALKPMNRSGANTMIKNTLALIPISACLFYTSCLHFKQIKHKVSQKWYEDRNKAQQFTLFWWIDCIGKIPLSNVLLSHQSVTSSPNKNS